MTEPELAVAASPREWSQRLYRYVVDHGGARLRATILSPQDALGERYDVFVVDDTTSYLSRRLVNELRAQGQRILGVYDPDDPAGKDDLLAIGVDDVVERSASPEEILRAVTALVRSAPIRRKPAGFAHSAPQPPSPQSAGRITAVAAVSGGCGATEVAIGLAAALAERSETCVLVDADDVAPSVAQRLATPMYPNLRAAVDLIQSVSGELESTLARPLGAGFGVLAGMSARTGWFESRPSELLALIAALARRHAHVMLNLGPRLEDVAASGGQTRYGHTRALLAAADVVVCVGLPDPVGVARLLDWVVEARTLAPTAPLHLVLNRAGASPYARAEVAAELGRSVTPASLSFLPFDGRVPAAGWAGEPVAGGPFARAVARLADIALPVPAGVGRRRWRR